MLILSFFLLPQRNDVNVSSGVPHTYIHTHAKNVESTQFNRREEECEQKPADLYAAGCSTDRIIF